MDKSDATRGEEPSEVGRLRRRVAELERFEAEYARAAAALADATEKLVEVQQVARLGFLEWDLATGDMYWSGQVHEMYGVPLDVRPTIDVAISLVHPDDIELVKKNLDECIRGPDPYFLDHRILRPDGGVIWITARAQVRRNADGEALSMFGTVVDITERKDAERVRQELEAQLQHFEKLKSLGVLAGGIAHDFNNLLVGILGNAELALEQMSPASPLREEIEDIVTAGLRAADLAKQMLAYAGRATPEVKELDLSTIVREMAHLLEAAVARSATVTYDLSAKLSLVQADPAQIHQVVMNLVSNAAEAGEEGQREITISTRMQRCDREFLKTAYVDDDLGAGVYVVLEVSDNGCGMDANTKAKMFDPFFTTKFMGRGLGLASFLGIIRSHGGAALVDSTPGVGTAVTVLLPPAHLEADNYSKSAEARPVLARSILVVDDEEDVRRLAGKMIKRLGFSLLLASDGVEAVAVFERHADEIALVLLDLTMPRGGGEQAFDAIRRLRPDAKVILCSGFAAEDITSRFADKGFTGFIHKPFRAQVLRRMISDALDGPTS
jgi:PAS domain S-box-containing protein